MIFLNIVFNSWSKLGLISTLILMVIPLHKMLPEMLLYTEDEVNIKSFHDCYLSFTNDYSRSNPMTRIKGFSKYLAALFEKNEISEEKYRELDNLLNSKNMDNMDDLFKFNFAHHIMLKTFGRNLKNQNLQLNIINYQVSNHNVEQNFYNNYQPINMNNLYINQNVYYPGNPQNYNNNIPFNYNQPNNNEINPQLNNNYTNQVNIANDLNPYNRPQNVVQPYNQVNIANDLNPYNRPQNQNIELGF